MMRRMKAVFGASLTLVSWSTLWCQAHSQDLITCGWDEVAALRITGTNVVTLWTWTATNSNLPEWSKPLFATTDECKPYPGGKVLVTSSGGPTLNGAVALIVPQASSASNVLFYARAPNAHSADLLPGNKVAVAMSYHPNGNRMAVFDLAQSDVELLSVDLFGAHGVVWDEARQVLWGLADTYIRQYRLQDWETNPQLHLISTTPLPDIAGHDMIPVANTPELTISTGSHCWLFNRDTRTFVKHPLLGNTPNVKSISTHPITSGIVYVQADTSWWTERLRFLAPAQTLHFPGARFYKARWLPPTAPQLSISLTSANTALISWPAAWTGFELQQNSDPDTATWITVAEAMEDDGTNKFVIINPPTGRSFYRLVKSAP
jgi:hypothetical protein